ncbi:MAG TPA: hypothetical protein DCK95_04865 [Anaerolineaceae bacterium]|nr:hypothetical protein [Anaerolineaceae bacterium]
MTFQLAQSVVEKLDGLQHLVDNEHMLSIQDSQKARLVAQTLNEHAHQKIEIKAWQVLAADYLHTLFGEIISAALSHESMQSWLLSYQSVIENYRSMVKTNKPDDAVMLDILRTSLMLQDEAFTFLTILFDGFPLLPNEDIRIALDGIHLDHRNLLTLFEDMLQSSPQDALPQLQHIHEKWLFLNEQQVTELDKTLKFIYEEIEEEQKRAHAPERVLKFKKRKKDSRNFEESAWKKNLVLIAKNANVWLVQLSRKYGRTIQHLDQIPVEELAQLADWGINSLWLIGVWERSPASERIKELYGRTETTASAYSIKEYRIAASLGGESAVDGLLYQCEQLGIKLCVDMVPNHTGVDATWLLEHPDWYISVPKSPIDSFLFNSPDLSPLPDVSIMLENGYYDQSGAAEVFLYEDKEKDIKQYIYHGNDGTSMPWNDTAQLDYLNPQVREQIIQTILTIVQRFPLMRFDAAMTLTKKHFQRLWYPLPNSKERCIPTRENNTMSAEEFDRRMPREFWKEVVERVAEQNPNAVLMAEAFWLMEGYFINELGMHRVYNSAFMNLLRDEENDKYQQVLKNALSTNPAILGRFVNFLNNPDERTAADQFGKSEKYFAVCTMLATMPGLPMIGHGQIEGFEERYGMDYLIPQWDEQEDAELIRQHKKWIFPLLRKRAYFADAHTFTLFDVQAVSGKSVPDVFAYHNQHGKRHHLVVVNNTYQHLDIHFDHSVPIAEKDGSLRVRALLDMIPPPAGKNQALVCREVRTRKKWTFKQPALKKDGLVFALDPYQHLVFSLTWKDEPAE